MWDDVADLFGSAELRHLGQFNDYQRWELGTYENEFVKDGGVAI